LVFIAVVLQGVTGGFLGPAIAAISLGLVGHSALAERLGRNQCFGVTGALVGAALMGVAVFPLSCAHINDPLLLPATASVQRYWAFSQR
jgi:hypothetical protein